MGRNEEFKTRYRVEEVGMVPPPLRRGYGQIDPDLHERLKAVPHHSGVQPLVEVPLSQPVRASQATVAKAKVDRIPRNAAGPESRFYRPPLASPFQGGVHLYDGHHRTAYAMRAGHETVAMAVFDPDNPQHVAHHAVVTERLKALHAPLHAHRGEIMRAGGFMDRPGTRPSSELEAKRAAFYAHQNEVDAKIQQFKTHARTRWLA